MQNPKVTIMIPTFNQANVICNAIESALNQDYKNLEVVVADDCSTDNTEKVIEKYLQDVRFKYHKNTENLKRVKNYYNTLNNLATGDYCLNLDGDDQLIDLSYISKAVELIEKEPEIVLVFSRIYLNYINENKKVASYKFKNIKEIMDGKWFFINYLNTDAINHTSAVYKRQIAIDVGFYTEDILWADWESLSKIVLFGKVGFVDNIVAQWNLHQENASNTIHQQSETFTENLKMFYNPINLAKEKKIFSSKVLNKWRKRNIYHYSLVIIGRLCLNKDFKQIKSHLKKLKKFEPKIALKLRFDIRIYIMFLIGNTFIERFLRKFFYRLKGAE